LGAVIWYEKIRLGRKRQRKKMPNGYTWEPKEKGASGRGFGQERGRDGGKMSQQNGHKGTGRFKERTPGQNTGLAKKKTEAEGRKKDSVGAEGTRKKGLKGGGKNLKTAGRRTITVPPGQWRPDREDGTWKLHRTGPSERTCKTYKVLSNTTGAGKLEKSKKLCRGGWVSRVKSKPPDAAGGGPRSGTKVFTSVKTTGKNTHSTGTTVKQVPLEANLRALSKQNGGVRAKETEKKNQGGPQKCGTA